MRTISVFLLAAAILPASTILDMPVRPQVGSVRQRIDPNRDLFGTRWTASFSNNTSVSCFWQEIAAGGGTCGSYFSLLNTQNANNWNRFRIKNTSGSLMTGLQIDVQTARSLKDMRTGDAGMLAWDAPSAYNTLGGVGHEVLGGFRSYQFINPLGGGLYGGLKLKTQVYSGRDFQFRGDMDQLVATPPPGTWITTLTGMVLLALGWRRRKVAA